MYHGVYIGAHSIDKQVHGDLAGRLAPAAHLRAAAIDNHKVIGFHHAFAHQRGSAQDCPVVHPHGEVAIGRGNQPILMKHFAEAYDIVAMLLNCSHTEIPKALVSAESECSYRIASTSSGKAKP